MAHERRVAGGKVYLVGAGPGAPGLITLRGVECLRRADLVLYDYLVNPRILQHARVAAERICLGHPGRKRVWTQAEVTAAMLEGARAGRIVVRLKGGDPAVFARGAEEAEVLAEQGIDHEIVPGITAALAAGSYAGVPLTHRELASAAAVITGQEIAHKDGPALDYGSLARFPGTLVVYMGRSTAPRWSAALIQAGLPDDTPAVIVGRCSLPDQTTTRCTLAEVPLRLSGPDDIGSPAIVIIGRVATLWQGPSWFERRPLSGQTVLVTRAQQQASELADLLEEQGARVLFQSAIAIRPPRDGSALDQALAHLAQYDWVVFSSVNGVRAGLERLESLGGDGRAFGTARIAAIGPATAQALAEFHLHADLVPDRYQAEDLGAALAEQARGGRVLLLRASRGREVLAERLVAVGAQVDQVIAYDSVDVETPDPDVQHELRSGRIDWTTVTSSAIARSLWRLFGEDLKNTRLVSISPVTSATLRELGLEPAAEAPRATLDGLAEILCQR